MKYIFVVVCAFVAVAAVNGQGFPTRECPPGEHSVLYCPRKAEPNCENPTVHDRSTPGACDTPDCFCDSKPKVTVRDLRTGKCVELSQCPQNVPKY